MKKIKGSLHDFFECLLIRMYKAEDEILEQLETVCKLVKSNQLRKIIETHIEETNRQVERIEKMLNILKVDTKKEEGLFEKGIKIAKDIASMGLWSKSHSVTGIIKDGKKIFDEFEGTDVHDLVISSGCQSIEMGEISAYKTLCQIAEECGYEDILRLLQETLREEENAYRQLSEISNRELKRLEKTA